MADPAAVSDMSYRPVGLAVSLRGVTKVYDNGVMALGPFDLDVRKGEFVTVGVRKIDGAAPDRRP
jgi:NitT/TauT family transport system ATP-binding protein